jgi:periplasmic protein TonB
MLNSRITKTCTAAIFGACILAGTLSSPAVAEEPKAVKIVSPDYPRGAERRKIEGFVVIEFGIQADGKTLNPTVIEAEPAGVFDAAAIKAVSKWEFETSAAETPGVQKKLRFQLQ